MPACNRLSFTLGNLDTYVDSCARSGFSGACRHHRRRRTARQARAQDFLCGDSLMNTRPVVSQRPSFTWRCCGAVCISRKQRSSADDWKSSSNRRAGTAGQRLRRSVRSPASSLSGATLSVPPGLDDLAPRCPKSFLSRCTSRCAPHVPTAHDGAQALAAAEHCEPDLIVVDMTLPVLSGASVVSRLRKRRGDSLPMLVTTADGHAAVKAREVGA
jgi:hypothetical protein